MSELPYNYPAFALAWSEWIQYRKEIKKPYKSDKSIERQLNWFIRHKLTVEQAIECIDEAIRNGWQGLFLPKNNLGNGQGANKQGGATPSGGGTSTNRTDALRRW